MLIIEGPTLYLCFSNCFLHLCGGDDHDDDHDGDHDDDHDGDHDDDHDGDHDGDDGMP